MHFSLEWVSSKKNPDGGVDVLMATTLRKVEDTRDCQTSFQRFDVDIDPETPICFTNVVLQASPCAQGDLGGPILQFEKKTIRRWYLS